MRVPKINPMVRATLVVGAAAGIVTGVTYALGDDDGATLANNTATTVNVDLKLWNPNTQAFANTVPGFQVTGLVPGEGSDPQSFYFQNNSAADLALSVKIPTEEEFEFDGNIDADDVTITFAGPCTADETDTANMLTATLADLQASAATGGMPMPCNPLPGDTNNPYTGPEVPAHGEYTATIDIDPTAATESSAKVKAFDLVFDAKQAVDDTEEGDGEG